MKCDVYDKVTAAIVAELEKGVRPWMKPWDAAHAAGPVNKPLRHNGQPYIRLEHPRQIIQSLIAAKMQ